LRQIKVSLNENLIAELELAAAKERRSLSEEVRERVMGTAGRVDLGRPDINELLDRVAEMAILAEYTTEQRWDRDSATAYLLQLGIVMLLRRHGAKEVSEILTSETFQRQGLVASTNPTEIATAMEAVVNYKLGFKHRLDEAFREARLEAEERVAASEAEVERIQEEIRERGKQ
jgi:metal-responsive CopG/Arc/MetJ family transcriptional regulator